jgi:hypothetical protein
MPTSFRFTDETLEQLKAICQADGRERQAEIAFLIAERYRKVSDERMDNKLSRDDLKVITDFGSMIGRSVGRKTALKALHDAKSTSEMMIALVDLQMKYDFVVPDEFIALTAKESIAGELKEYLTLAALNEFAK